MRTECRWLISIILIEPNIDSTLVEGSGRCISIDESREATIMKYGLAICSGP